MDKEKLIFSAEKYGNKVIVKQNKDGSFLIMFSGNGFTLKLNESNFETAMNTAYFYLDGDLNELT